MGDRPDYDYARQVTIKAYALQENRETSTVVYEARSISGDLCGADPRTELVCGAEPDAVCRIEPVIETAVRMRRAKDSVQIWVDADKPCRIVLVNERAREVTGAVWEQQGADCVMMCPGSVEVTVTLSCRFATAP